MSHIDLFFLMENLRGSDSRCREVGIKDRKLSSHGGTGVEDDSRDVFTPASVAGVLYARVSRISGLIPQCTFIASSTSMRVTRMEDFARLMYDGRRSPSAKF